MERLDRAPASDAAPAKPAGCRRMPSATDFVRCAGMNVPIASLISELSIAGGIADSEIVFARASRGNRTRA